MSGHSKWHSIKHKKAATDAKKGKIFTQSANMITIAVRQGGSDPKMNFSLRLAIEKAKSVNFPTANIERAIKKGTGEIGGSQIEEFTYEGYGPSGIALLVETTTDNKNRTVGEVRAAFTKHGGSLATTGSVAYLFDKKGRIASEKKLQKVSSDDLDLLIIESGADDFEEDDEQITVYTKPTDLLKVREALEHGGVIISDANFVFIPQNEVKVKDAAKASSIIKLMDALESLDDVVAVHANFDIDEEILKKISD